MAATSSQPRGFLGIAKKWWLVGLVAIPIMGIAAARFLLTARLEQISPGESKPIERTSVSNSVAPLPDWPVAPLTGKAGVEFLLVSLRAAEARLDAAGGYTAVMRRQERINGKLGDEQVMDLKCRHHPFAIYIKFRTPEKGKEVVYADFGKYKGQVVAHGVGFSRRIVPRIMVPPDHMLAMSGNRHPVTDAGIDNLTKKLIRFRLIDLDDPDAETIVDRVKNDEGRELYRSRHSHPSANGVRPFKYIEVLYDPSDRIPRQIQSYDWPAAGDVGPLKLAEKYTYADLNLEAPLSDLDFDPANPAYDFAKF